MPVAGLRAGRSGCCPLPGLGEGRDQLELLLVLVGHAAIQPAGTDAPAGRQAAPGSAAGLAEVLPVVGPGIDLLVGPVAEPPVGLGRDLRIGLAIEMGCEVEDIGHTIHPHPTLSESVGMAAEVYDGTITDLYIPKKK